MNEPLRKGVDKDASTSHDDDRTESDVTSPDTTSTADHFLDFNHKLLIILPKFEGNDIEFYPFWRTFNEVIDNATDLTDHQKHEFLLKRLGAKPKAKIQGYRNYADMKNRLVKFYTTPMLQRKK